MSYYHRYKAKKLMLHAHCNTNQRSWCFKAKPAFHNSKQAWIKNMKLLP